MISLAPSRFALLKPISSTSTAQNKRPIIVPVTAFRMNTCGFATKHATLSAFKINTYKKQGGGGSLLLTTRPTKGACPERPPGVDGPLTSRKSFKICSRASNEGVCPARPSGVEGPLTGRESRKILEVKGSQPSANSSRICTYEKNYAFPPLPLASSLPMRYPCVSTLSTPSGIREGQLLQRKTFGGFL